MFSWCGIPVLFLLVVCVAILPLFGGPGCFATDLVVNQTVRIALITNASVRFPDREALISSCNLTLGQPNSYGIENLGTIECDFIEPSPDDVEGGVTPKFQCAYTLPDGSTLQLKVKYDQQHNPLAPGKRNNEVYASVVSERVLWAMGYGADAAVPVRVLCRGCPIEPWTYVRESLGLQNYDYVDGWVNLGLIIDGRWRTKVPLLELNYSLAYVNWNDVQPADRVLLNTSSGPQEGWSWPEMYSYAIPNDTAQRVERDALTVVAAFLSHADNYGGNQGLNCLHTNESQPPSADAPCSGLVPFLFLHDVGLTLGYGWDLFHLDFWPDAMDLKQWLELSVWKSLTACEVQVHKVPGGSFSTQIVSDQARALAASLLVQITPTQLTDLFTVARVQAFRGDSVPDWVAGWQFKLQRDLLSVRCGN